MNPSGCSSRSKNKAVGAAVVLVGSEHQSGFFRQQTLAGFKNDAIIPLFIHILEHVDVGSPGGYRAKISWFHRRSKE